MADEAEAPQPSIGKIARKQQTERQAMGAKNTSQAMPQRPATNDAVAWRAYWRELGQPWRTEPEIPPERQQVLADRRAMEPNIEQSIYPFQGIEPKLSRADVEWLLATHESGGMREPVDWADVSQRNREGLTHGTRRMPLGFSPRG